METRVPLERCTKASAAVSSLASIQTGGRSAEMRLSPGGPVEQMSPGCSSIGPNVGAELILGLCLPRKLALQNAFLWMVLMTHRIGLTTRGPLKLLLWDRWVFGAVRQNIGITSLAARQPQVRPTCQLSANIGAENLAIELFVLCLMTLSACQSIASALLLVAAASLCDGRGPLFPLMFISLQGLCRSCFQAPSWM